MPLRARPSPEGTAFADVPQGPDRAWLRSCIDYLVQRDR